MTSPSVTLVVVPRERFSYARQMLDAIYRKTDYPFDLVYVDGCSPDPVRRYLEHESTTRLFRLIRCDTFVSPNRARNIGLQHVHPSSKYVVFIDNDVEVERGWLSRLITCAEETGAWAVSPVYFEGVPRDEVIHMAGGYAEFEEKNGVRAFHEDHLHNQKAYRATRPVLRRESTGFFEFHAVLLRLTALNQLGPLDEALLSSHEHLDLSLLIRQAGGSICLEPDSLITYVYGLLDDYDLQYASLRWSDEWNRSSAAHFAKKWQLDVDAMWIESAADWGRRHLEHLKRLRRSPRTILKWQAKTNLLTRRAYGWLRAATQ